MKRVLTTLGILLGLTLIIGFGYSLFRSQPKKANDLTIVGSFYPLTHFAEQVAGDRAQIINLVPVGTEPHEFEPTAQDIATLQSAKLFIYNGSGLDPWADRIAAELTTKGVKVIKMSEYLSLLDQDQNEQTATDSSPTDPHFWLDPILAQRETMVIAEALQQIDPAHSEEYQSAVARYIERLAKLDQEFRQSLAHCDNRPIITSHAAFGYLAKRYTIKVISIAGLSPDEEPSSQQLTKITELVKQNKTPYIFVESLTSPKLAETIANETGAKTLLFNPLEGLTAKEVAEGQDYISVMRSNLDALNTALNCR